MTFGMGKIFGGIVCYEEIPFAIPVHEACTDFLVGFLGDVRVYQRLCWKCMC